MTFDKALIAGKLRRWEKYLDNYRLPEWEAIPDFGLYMEQVIDLLKEKGYTAERRTIQDDIRCLEDAGFDILVEKSGKNNQYHLGGRTFDNAELIMLIDAVSSSRFIPEDKSDELIAKLASLSSSFSQQRLDPKIYTAKRIKTDNKTVFITSDIMMLGSNSPVPAP